MEEEVKSMKWTSLQEGKRNVVDTILSFKLIVYYINDLLSI